MHDIIQALFMLSQYANDERVISCLQVTQAIIEFEEGNQGLIDRLNSGDLGGQLGDGGMGQLGHSDSDGQVHGPSILTGKVVFSSACFYYCNSSETLWVLTLMSDEVMFMFSERLYIIFNRGETH